MSGTTRLSTVAIKNGSEIIAKTATPGNVYNVSSALADMENSSAKFIVEAVAPNGATLTGTLSASSFIPDGTGRAVPTLASFQGGVDSKTAPAAEAASGEQGEPVPAPAPAAGLVGSLALKLLETVENPAGAV